MPHERRDLLADAPPTTPLRGRTRELEVVAAELRADEETRHIKIIAVTAYAMKGEKDIFMDRGFDGYISKPIDNKSFLNTVASFLKAEG